MSPAETMQVQDTIRLIVEAETWSQRIAQLRLIPQRHGTSDHLTVYAEVARALYLPHLTPDFAFIHNAPFYDREHFFGAYGAACQQTREFTDVSEETLARVLGRRPASLLVFRTILGLTKEEFSHATVIAAEKINLEMVAPSVIDTMERADPETSPRQTHSTKARAKLEAQNQVLAKTITEVMNGTLFGPPPEGMRLKQSKPDTDESWTTVHQFANDGVPLEVFLHQRHYGGAYRQVLDATSSLRGDMIEDAVGRLFDENGISHIRTGRHNQADIADRFEVQVTPAPDFVVFDPLDDGLRAMLECKGTNNGGTARDKALRFNRLREESVRLGGIPLFAVLGGIGWARINDALAPVLRDTDGRVFTISTLPSIMEVAPFPSLRQNSDCPS